MVTPMAQPGEGFAVHVAHEHFRGVGHLAQSALAHLVDAQFGGVAEAVFGGAQNAVHVLTVALELQHGIHDVLKHLGPRQRALPC